MLNLGLRRARTAGAEPRALTGCEQKGPWRGRPEDRQGVEGHRRGDQEGRREGERTRSGREK